MPISVETPDPNVRLEKIFRMLSLIRTFETITWVCLAISIAYIMIRHVFIEYLPPALVQGQWQFIISIVVIATHLVIATLRLIFKKVFLDWEFKKTLYEFDIAKGGWVESSATKADYDLVKRCVKVARPIFVPGLSGILITYVVPLIFLAAIIVIRSR